MLCVRDCISGVWREVQGKAEPVQPDLCNLCSHCIAVCPKDAVRHSDLDSLQAKPVKKQHINPSAYRETVLSRRSVRHFKDDREIPRETIEEIINIARYSPTASNDQNVSYIVITDKKLIKSAATRIFRSARRLHSFSRKRLGKFILKITGNTGNRYLRLLDYIVTENRTTGRDFILHNAPVLILLHAPEKTRFAPDNCAIAATNIINYAHTRGLGSCYTGILQLALGYSGKLRKLMNIPKGSSVYASLVLGYPAYNHSKTVSRKDPDVRWI